jgi:hypothetical protein
LESARQIVWRFFYAFNHGWSFDQQFNKTLNINPMTFYPLQTKGPATIYSLFKLVKPFKTWFQTAFSSKKNKALKAPKTVVHPKNKLVRKSVVLISSFGGIGLCYFLLLPFYASMDHFAFFLMAFLVAATFLEISHLVWGK